MKTILTIGYQDLELPASVNVNAILLALNKARPVEGRYQASRKIFIRSDQQVDIAVKLVADEDVIDSKKLKRLPEHASEDSHNTFGS